MFGALEFVAIKFETSGVPDIAAERGEAIKSEGAALSIKYTFSYYVGADKI